MCLERAFDEEEVLDVVRGMAKDKTVFGWFFYGFFQACWDSVREDIINGFLEFHLFMKF